VNLKTNSGVVDGITPQPTGAPGQSASFQPQTGGPDAISTIGSRKPKSFYGSVTVNPSMAKIRLVQPAEEIISNLASNPQAELKITVEINAHFPNGATDQIKRGVRKCKEP
jgi:uncharacterized protein